MSKPALPSVITSAGGQSVAVRTATGAPIRREKFSAVSVADAGALAAQLQRMHSTLDDAHDSATANPLARSVRFDGVAFGAGGLTTTITHNLGHAPNWIIVGWRGATDGPNVVEDTSPASLRNGSTLTLISKIAGTGDVLVF